MIMNEMTTHLRRALQYSQGEYNRLFFDTAYKWLQYWFSDDLAIMDAMTKVSKRKEFWDYWQLCFDAMDKALVQTYFENRDRAIFQDLEFVRAVHITEHSTHDLFPEASLFKSLAHRYNDAGIGDEIEPAQIRSSCFKLNDLNAKLEQARKQSKVLRMSKNGIVFYDALKGSKQPKKV